MLLREESACQSQTCCPIGNDHSVTIARVVRSRTKHVLIACDSAKDIAVTLCASHDDGSSPLS